MSKVFHSLWIAPLILIGRLFGALVLYRGKGVPVNVRNYCETSGNQLRWQRRFFFQGHKPAHFDSYMEHLGGNEIVEFVRFGLGLCLKLTIVDGALCYTTAGYLWRIGPLHLRFPDWLLLGSGTIIERTIDSELIELDFTLTHPLFGLSYSYVGRFHIMDIIGSDQ
jgi:hypothetical protein